MQVGDVLVDLQAANNGNGLFRKYLKAVNIQPSTAYDIIADYERVIAMKLPPVLVQAAAASGIDIGMKKYAVVIQDNAAKLRKVATKAEARTELESVLKAGRRPAKPTAKETALPSALSRTS